MAESPRMIFSAPFATHLTRRHSLARDACAEPSEGAAALGDSIAGDSGTGKAVFGGSTAASAIVAFDEGKTSTFAGAESASAIGVPSAPALDTSAPARNSAS